MPSPFPREPAARRCFFYWFCAVLVWLVGLAPGGVHAEGAADPEALFEQGVGFADQGDWAAAEGAFERVCELAPTPNAVFNLAVARFHLGQPLGALDALDGLEGLEALSDAQAETAEQLRAEFLAEVAILKLDVDPGHAVVELDGALLAPDQRELRTLPGLRQLRATAPYYETLKTEVLLAKGERTVLRLHLLPTDVQAAPRAEPDHGARRRRWLWATAAVLVTGAALTAGLLARNSQAGTEPCELGTTGVGFGACAP